MCDITLLCVVLPRVWRGLTGCGVALLGVAWPYWVWHGLTGCCACGMASVGVERFQ